MNTLPTSLQTKRLSGLSSCFGKGAISQPWLWFFGTQDHNVMTGRVDSSDPRKS